MASSSRLRLSDYRKIVALLGECRDLGDDATLWRRHLATQLARLLGSGLAAVGEIDHFAEAADRHHLVEWAGENALTEEGYRRVMAEYNANPLFSPIINTYRERCVESPGISLSRPDLLADREWYPSHFYQAFAIPTGIDEILLCARPLQTDPRRHYHLAITRLRGDRQISGREKRILNEVNLQLTPMLGRVLAGQEEPAPSALPQRSRAVLRCVLEGDGDKQIARRLNISPHTVNDHLKKIYQHFGVESRSELLARWIRRGWGSTFRWLETE
jgi:DNA-binding CsgD family transcriptional regulator